MPHPQIRRAGKWNTIIQQGSTFIRNLRVDARLDLSDYDFRGQIRAGYGTPVLASYSFELIDNTGFEVRLTSAETAAIPAGDYLHDIEIFTEDDEFVARIVEGKVKVTPEVTK